MNTLLALSIASAAGLAVSRLARLVRRDVYKRQGPCRLSGWWIAVDSNHRPLAYQASALTS